MMPPDDAARCRPDKSQIHCKKTELFAPFFHFKIIFHKLVSAIAAKINAGAAHTFPVIFCLKTIESQSTVSSMLTPRANG